MNPLGKSVVWFCCCCGGGGGACFLTDKSTMRIWTFV